jgi:hypothetical protein
MQLQKGRLKMRKIKTSKENYKNAIEKYDDAIAYQCEIVCRHPSTGMVYVHRAEKAKKAYIDRYEPR